MFDATLAKKQQQPGVLSQRVVAADHRKTGNPTDALVVSFVSNDLLEAVPQVQGNAVDLVLIFRKLPPAENFFAPLLTTWAKKWA